MMVSKASKGRARSPNTRDIMSLWVISRCEYLPASFGSQRLSLLATIAPKTSGRSPHFPWRVYEAMRSTYYNCKNTAVQHHTHNLEYADRYYDTALAPLVVWSNCHPGLVLRPILYRAYRWDHLKSLCLILAVQTKLVSSVTALDFPRLC